MPDVRLRLSLTTSIATAYVSKNRLPASEVGPLVIGIAAALDGPAAEPIQSRADPAPSKAQIRRSIRPDALISFEDGKSYKMLKRHLTALGLTPDAYRRKWGLPDDYPMTAPGYSATRSTHARRQGLGSKLQPNTPAARRPANS